MDNFRDKYVWIIGASSGIGQALAVELSSQGANLILSARRKDELEKLNKELGGNHLIYELDVNNSDTVTRTAKAIQASVPKLDSVIFMAAVYAASEAERTKPDIIKQIVDVNLTGGIYVANAVLPIFKEQQNGQLAICASVAGYTGLPGGQPYSATKAGLINFAESLHSEVGDIVDIKVINPGFVKTRITDKNEFPMPMIIQTEDAAKAIVKGLTKRGFEIHFPKRFTYFVKFLSMLPYSLKLFITRKLRDK